MKDSSGLNREQLLSCLDFGKALVCVPIVFAGRTLGVLEMVNPRALDKQSVELLTVV